MLLTADINACRRYYYEREGEGCKVAKHLYQAMCCWPWRSPTDFFPGHHNIGIVIVTKTEGILLGERGGGGEGRGKGGIQKQG